MPINFAVKLIATVALEAMQMGLQASKHTYGPRLSETQMTTADYGTPLPRFKGERRFAGQIVWSRDLEIVDHTTKVKGGGKQTNQSALWTGGVAFSDCRGAVGPIDKVLKIWLDETLAYDAGVGPISYASSLGFDLASVMRIYLGTDDQAVDPAYADYCEERYGPNSAPAFRGTAMLVFDRMPLDNFGNRAPQISVLAVSSASDAFPFERKDTDQSTDGLFAFSPNGGGWMAYYDQAGQIEWWDAPTRTLIGNSPAPGLLSSTVTNASLLSDGTAYIAGDTFDGGVLAMTSPLGEPVVTLFTGGASDFVEKVRAFSSSAVYTIYQDHTGYALGTDHVSHTLGLRDCGEAADGSIVGVFQPDGSSSSYTIEHLAGGSLSGTFTATSRSDRSAATICHVAASGHFFVTMNGHFYLHDDSDLSLIASGTISVGTGDREAKNPNATSFWGSYSEYSLADGSLIRTVDPNDWLSTSAHSQKYDPVNVAIWERRASGSPPLEILYLDRAANAGVTLGTIISAMCTDAGLEDRDTSLLTQRVLGYSWTRGDVKSQMEPLLDIHDVDACPHDFTLKFLPRGSAPSGTIITADFAKNGENPRYKTVEAQDTDLPKLLRVNFSDTGFDQQTNNILSPLPVDVVDSQNDVVIDLTTSADTPTGAQQKGDRYMRRTWNGRDRVELSLTARYRDIEPGVVMTLDLDGIQWNAKLEKQSFVGGRMDCTFRRDETALATLNSSTTGPEMEARDPEVISIPPPIKGFIVDAPYRADSDDDVRPLLYDGAGAYGQLAFTSAAIWEETGAGASAAYDQLFATVSTGATWGTCSGTLGDVPSPWLWDRGNTLTVSLQAGSLTSVSEDDIGNDPTLNLILIGRPGAWEYVNFTTATLVSGSTYTLSGFKRGRRGTEWACGGHAAGEAFVLASSLDADELGTDDVGGSLSFKAQALGRSLDAAPANDVDPFTGATLKPYAPARIDWSTDGTDLIGTIIRRTRVGGSWTDSGVVPLSENSEGYEVDVLDGPDVVRTITVNGTNVFTYASADLVADGFSLSDVPAVDVYQMSDAVGRGFALAA
jgi:hypothetical protein